MKINELIMKYHASEMSRCNEPLCFLSGGMTGLTEKERTEWRNKIKLNEIIFIDPTIFDPDNLDPEYQQNGYEYCIAGIINCDFVVVNLDNQKSVGTAQEIMLAWLLSKPIIGLYTRDEPLHPWYKNKINSLFNNLDSLKLYLQCLAFKYNTKEKRDAIYKNDLW